MLLKALGSGCEAVHKSKGRPLSIFLREAVRILSDLAERFAESATEVDELKHIAR
jgi:hypothetical protein